MKKSIIANIGVTLIITIFLSGCSVYMAAKGTSGADLAKTSKCKTRACLISSGAKPIENAQKNNEGQLKSEIFKVSEPTGSAARAVMHGMLDLSTFGVWEIAGTPIEGVLNKQKSVAILVNYEDDGYSIKSMSIN